MIVFAGQRIISVLLNDLCRNLGLRFHLSKPLLQPNKIGVDTGAWKSGVFTAARMSDRQIFQASKENVPYHLIRI